MASRADQQDRATGFAEILAKDFADTDAGRLVKSLAAFYDGLAGPAMSKRERLNLYLESTAVARRIGPYA